MKIEKEIIFAAKIDEVRAILDNYGFMNNRPLYNTEKPSKAALSGHSVKNADLKKAASSKDVGNGKPNSPITAIYDLAECGNRTLLKVTVHGWEKANPEQAKVEMPQIALQLERELSRLKKRLESHS